MDLPITVFVPMWGDRIDMFLRFVLPSLLQGGNLPALPPEAVKFAICTLKGQKSQCQLAAESIPYPATVLELDDPLLLGLRYSLQTCHSERRRLLLAMPDVVFGNGSIANLIRYAHGKTVNVAAAHLRVNRSTFAVRWPVSNAQLVDLAMEYPHQTLRASWVVSDNGTMDGGVSLRDLGGGLISCVHQLPTVFLATPQPEDVSYWMQKKPFGDWDHMWPSLLLPPDRYRVIGSSDAFFAAELTDEHANTIRIRPNSAHSESYAGSRPHHTVNRCFVTILRRSPTLP